MRRFAIAILLLVVAGAPVSAATHRKVNGYETDDARPGLKVNREYDLDAPGANQSTTSANIGSVPAASAAVGVTVTEYGSGVLHQTVFTVAVAALTVTDAGAAGAHGSIQLYDFPAGVITFLGASSTPAITAGAGGLADTAAVVGSVGTVTAATDNATLTSTEADIIPSTISTLSGGIGAMGGQSTTALLLAFDGTATPVDAFLNFAAPDAGSSASDTLAIAGTVTVTWLWSGDN